MSTAPNETIRRESFFNRKLEVVIIDITTADYNALRLAPDVIDIIQGRFITLIFWESLQKFGLLHTDQAQYGRVFAWSTRMHWPQTIRAMQGDAQREMYIPDAQVGAYIFKTCHALLTRIRIQHFSNGEILRESVVGSLANTTHAVPLRNPFVSLHGMNGTNTMTLSRIANFFGFSNRTRESFGHFYTTMTGVSRISAGAENFVDALILSFSLDYFVQYDYSQIYDELIVASNAFDINDAQKIILYCSLVKALLGNSIIKAFPFPMDPIEQCAKNILNNHKRIRCLLNGSSQFMNDMHTLLGSKVTPTPAKASPTMAYGFFPAARGRDLSYDHIDELVPLLE